ncbi:MAG: hypothetical protein K8T25_15080 [Planctomycetia bacterium]|nr:hypothetical protein [Planctomycetia bacterium]
MGLFQRFFGSRRAARRNGVARSGRAKQHSARHVCHFEPLEERRLLAADIHLGAVYFDPTVGDDSVPNTIQISFEGGAPGTELTHIIINGDKLGDGQVTLGDVFFDTESGGLGAFKSNPVKIVASDGFTVTNIKVSDGSPILEFDLSGFTAGDKLVFTVDVDEMGLFKPNSLAEGGEFEGSKLTGTFTNTHYQDVQGSATFFDDYDDEFAAVATATGTTLNLPNDSNMPPATVDQSDHTAGAVLSLKQTPKPITIAGTVYSDQNLDNSQDNGETGIGGVKLTLERLDGNNNYVSTGLTATTDADGHYKFSDPSILPGTYRVVETQPPNYFSVGAQPGTIDGMTVGHVDNPDRLSQITVQGGDNSILNNFGEAKPAALSGFVYHDRNNNGLKEAGEEGIGGTTIQVIPVNTIDGSTSPIQTTTNSDGSWSVTGLAPGTYRVVEVQPASWIDGLDTPGNAGGTATNPGDQIAGITLKPDQTGVNYNFGELKPGSISGQVHVDLNGDCIYQPGEPLLSGVTMQLLDAQGKVIATTTTDAKGEYKFDNLAPGTYGVQELQPQGYYNDTQWVGSAGGVVTAQDRIEQIAIGSDVQAVHYDYCESLPGSISGQVHVDLNGDCIYQPGEPLLSGVTMQLLDSSGKVIATTTTDANGEYKFDNLEKGTYGVQELQPAGYYNDTQWIGSAGGVVTAQDRMEQIVLGSGFDAVHYDYCESLHGCISGVVHADLNGDCIYQPGEPLLSGVTMQLLDSTGKVIATTKTDANGEYKFDNLEKGTYGVQELQPAGYFNDTQWVGSVGGVVTAQDRIEQIVIGSGVNAVHYDYCESLPGSISGVVHADLNGDCIYQPGEPLLSGVTMQLLDSTGKVIATTKTDANGEYKFDGLEKGTYGVQELQPTGYFNDTQWVGSVGGVVTARDRIEQIVIGSGVAAVHYDYCESLPGSISGVVHADLNGDCIYQPGEPLIAGVTMQLLDSTGKVIATTKTDANGEYHFNGLEKGTYGVQELQPTGYFNDTQWVGSVGGVVTAQDRIEQIVIGSGVNAIHYDYCESLPGTIAGSVHVEVPGQDCQVNPGPPIAGVVIQLLDTEGNVLAFTTTDSNGAYKFTGLEKGTYGVREIQPADYEQGDQHVGSGGGVIADVDLTTQIAVHSGEDLVHYDFCETQPPPPPRVPLPPPPTPPGAPRLAALIPQQNNPLVPPPFIPPTKLPDDFGGVDGSNLYTWHLSVTNAGQPRAADQSSATADASDGTLKLIPASAESHSDIRMDDGEWTILEANGQLKKIVFGNERGTPIVGDFKGDGKAELGVYVDGQWFIDLNGDGVWDNGDMWAKLGTDKDYPVVGDWDGDGKIDIGIFGPAWTGDPRAIYVDPGLPDPYNTPTGAMKNLPPKVEDAALGKRELTLKPNGKLRADLIDHVFAYGRRGDVPIVGDWNGDGVRTIGIFRDGVWYLDSNGDGRFDENDRVVQFGQAGDIPVVGDWTGKGKDMVGVYRHGTWYLDTNGNGELDASDKVFELGGADDIPVVGNWSGDGVDRPGVYHRGHPNRVTADFTTRR